MRVRHAVTRRPGADAAAGLTSADLDPRGGGPLDLDKLLAQHAAYEAALRGLGVAVHSLPPLAGHPDAYFVEDVAVIVPSLAVITRPGALPRRGETGHIEAALAPAGELRRIEAPGTLDGGDVLCTGARAFIGLSERTNEAGARQLGELLSDAGFDCRTLEVGGGLHLKSSVNALDEETLLITAELAAHPAFAGFRHLVLDPADAYAANALRVNDRVLLPAGFPRVAATLADAGFDCLELDVSEARRMDGGLTCLSLRY